MVQVNYWVYLGVMGISLSGGDGNWPEPLGLKWDLMVSLMNVDVTSPSRGRFMAWKLNPIFLPSGVLGPWFSVVIMAAQNMSLLVKAL